jgi:hypothetical protein
MKESVFAYQGVGSYGRTDLEVLLDIGRPLTDNDNWAIRQCVEDLIKKLQAETIRLRPETKEEFENTKARLLQLFGNRAIFVETIPNGYCPCAICDQTSPWFIVTTDKGRIKIGWRKRVINIDWTDSQIKQTGDQLFPNEDVTKWETGIHAWGYEKAKEYLDVILK